MRFRNTLAAILWLTLAVAVAFGQTPAPTEREDVFGAGASYNSSPEAIPSAAGTIMYAHRVSEGLYSFTIVDIFAQAKDFTDPATGAVTSKYQITTTPTTGVAQHLRDIAGAKIYVIATVGAAAGGSQVGWAYSTGGAAYIGLGKGWCLIPNIRLMKSSLSGDYQGIFGIMFGWGK